MKTHELEKELGISKHTIFYYEKEGIITPQRDDNGYRSYSQEDLQKLIMVKFLRNLNISIDDVKAILNNELDFKECLEINQIHLEKLSPGKSALFADHSLSEPLRGEFELSANAFS